MDKLLGLSLLQISPKQHQFTNYSAQRIKGIVLWKLKN